MNRSIQKLRFEYASAYLLEENFANDPLKQFSLWIKEAIKAKVLEPNAMTLSTVSATGHPSSRMVLLKGFDSKGFTFFTHYQSRKGQQLQFNPHAALNFWWREIYRQVCVEGMIVKTSRQESETYFSKRPRGAQLAVHASMQSTPLASREELLEIYNRLKKTYASKKIPCPKHWGGYRLSPDRIEFWQGQPNRLHERFLYVKSEKKEWIFTRLAP